MNLSDTLQKYIDDLSSNSPTPGGGNASAFSGALACSLGIMVCGLTIGKKKYADVEEDIKLVRDKLESKKALFLELADKDNRAFDNVMAAFKLPKETEEQKKHRHGEIEKATVAAAEVPARVVEICSYVLPLLGLLAEKGNQNSVSDAGVAVSLTETAAQGAFLNVLINYNSLTDKTPADSLFINCGRMLQEIRENTKNIITVITEGLAK
jgi:glutamate formiminotransferase/formiminotetrahydrofolate cyclodeaminase